MAKNKYFLTVRYKTKEDFDKRVEEIYYSGYEHGFIDGRVDALGDVISALDKDFSGREQFEARNLVRSNNIRKWQKEQKAREEAEKKEMDKLIKEVAEEAEKKYVFTD